MLREVPRHPVVNRRNLAPLVRRSVSLTPEGIAAADALGKRLRVSQGSLIDTALRELAARADAEVVEALAAHGHLTAEERAVVEAGLRPGPEPKP